MGGEWLKWAGSGTPGTVGKDGKAEANNSAWWVHDKT